MPKHHGKHRHRLADNPQEQAFADAWEEVNKMGVLMTLLDSTTYAPQPTEAEVVAAATVIQWLGSPVGQDFLQDVGFVPASKS